MPESDWIREFKGVSNADLHEKYIQDKVQIGCLLGRPVLGDVISKETMEELYKTDRNLALHFDRTVGHIAQRIIDKMYRS